MAETMTIHRALAELKLIDKRIAKKINDYEPVAIKKDNLLVGSTATEEEFKTSATAGIQSIKDLIARRFKIKNAIVAANTVTIVEVAGVKMTIADAINNKSLIDIQRQLSSHLSHKLNRAMVDIERHNLTIDQQALQLAEAALGKDNVQIKDGDVEAIITPYTKKNKMELVDPIGVKKVIEQREEQVSTFETEVDAALSEINAITVITIE